VRGDFEATGLLRLTGSPALHLARHSGRAILQRKTQDAFQPGEPGQ